MEKNTSKEAILSALRSSGAEVFPKPNLGEFEVGALTFEKPLESFCEAVRTAGGQVVSGAAVPVEDQFVINGKFGVAENGAIWIDEIPSGATRRDIFIHERLVVKLDGTQIVNNMHEAYKRLGETPSGYGIFISGPSKTADIEQALVFGAHGPKELVVEIY